jgi:hypothetical protein
MLNARAGLLAVVLAVSALIASAQRRAAFDLSLDHPAIAYRTQPTNDPVARLSAAVERGGARLAFDPDHGYLRALLDQLRVPIESQVVVFSGTSKQADLITASNPRAIFFSDSVAVGWVRGGAELEIAASDSEQGVVFYTLDQRQVERPVIRRDKGLCLQCHLTWETRGVPGLVVMSTLSEPAPDDKYSYATGSFVDHRSAFTDRWGGWYITGRTGPARHLGNDIALPGRKGPPLAPPRPLESLKGLFDPRGFPSLHSDVASLLVLEHQSTMTNLLTWTNWEARVSAHGPQASAARLTPPGAVPPEARLQGAVDELVDYMLFVDETPLPGPMSGTSGFAEIFAAAGPRDARGRSLRQLDLQRRLLRFPCSYLIYSEAFDRLPGPAKMAVYERMWRILSGQEQGARYAHLTTTDRQAVVEILRETKGDWPGTFSGSLRR